MDGEIVISPDKLTGGVYSFQDFKDWYDESPHQRTLAWGKIDTLRQRLEQSNEGIQDPIIFLYDLYYDKSFSIRKILTHPLVDGIYSPKGLQQLFVNSFGWELRKKTDRTPEHQTVIDNRVQDGIQVFEKRVKDLIGRREQERVFKMDEYKKKTYRIGKALYILKTLGGIDKNLLFEIASQGGLGARVLANALNKQLQDILERYPLIDISFDELELRPQSIERWFGYKENQQ